MISWFPRKIYKITVIFKLFLENNIIVLNFPLESLLAEKAEAEKACRKDGTKQQVTKRVKATQPPR